VVRSKFGYGAGYGAVFEDERGKVYEYRRNGARFLRGLKGREAAYWPGEWRLSEPGNIDVGRTPKRRAAIEWLLGGDVPSPVEPHPALGVPPQHLMGDE
jgi:hypothetical protein